MELVPIGTPRPALGARYRVRQLNPVVRDFLETHGQIQLLLRTPYGIAWSNSILVVGSAVSWGGGSKSAAFICSRANEPSLAEMIQRWYGIKPRRELEQIDVTVDFILNGELRIVLVPLAIKEIGHGACRELASTKPQPLGLNSSVRHSLWQKPVERLGQDDPEALAHLRKQLVGILRGHPHPARVAWKAREIETFAKAISVCGFSLGKRVGNSCAFAECTFRLGGLPSYRCAVEFRRSLGEFDADRYYRSPLPRAVVFTVREQPNYLSRNFDHFAVETLVQILN